MFEHRCPETPVAGFVRLPPIRGLCPPLRDPQRGRLDASRNIGKRQCLVANNSSGIATDQAAHFAMLPHTQRWCERCSDREGRIRWQIEDF